MRRSIFIDVDMNGRMKAAPVGHSGANRCSGSRSLVVEEGGEGTELLLLLLLLVVVVVVLLIARALILGR